jgi:hypothetical protein
MGAFFSKKDSSLRVISCLGYAVLIAATSASCSKPRTEEKASEQSAASKNKSDAAPVVLLTRVETLEQKPSVAPDQTKSPSVAVTITVNRQALLDQEFLYGADLQYSSYYDPGYDLYLQSLAIGHIPARFRISGNELQLIADNRRLYPSDVNHPEQLLSRFAILSQDANTLTLSGANSSVFLAQVFEATHTDSAGKLSNAAGQAPRDSWIRSFEFDANGNYLLQQTSVVMSDGSIAEFMEAIFPRSTLAPGSDFEQFALDPNDPVGAQEGPAARYRFLPGERIFNGEEILTYAQHYDISKTAANPEGTIEWYVTPNIPEEDLQPVAQAVEGWNRYFKNFKGVERDVVRFKGRLPEGVHLGDPRYNVINWDSRLIAGAAYESQANDPLTGKQSHSLIYMPAAWLKIGMDYWKNGQTSDLVDESTARIRAGKGARLACLRDMHEAAAVLASGRLSRDEAETFGIQLLKGTLHHEVGHALGLHHNFKGSLSFDRKQKGSIFSTSIMDYNDFEIERGAFDAVDSANGPQLEYDRQVLSALYNKMKDVAANDPILPACNDAEADQEEGGVDPLCLRYDIEANPTLSIATAFDRIEKTELDGDVPLSQALGRVPDLVLNDRALESIKDGTELKAAVGKLASSLKGAMSFYILSGKASVSRVVRTNAESLLIFAEGILPDTFSGDQMRGASYLGIQKALALTALPEAVNAGIAQAKASSLERLKRTAYVQSLSAHGRGRIDSRFRDLGIRSQSGVRPGKAPSGGPSDSCPPSRRALLLREDGGRSHGL